MRQLTIDVFSDTRSQGIRFFTIRRALTGSSRGNRQFMKSGEIPADNTVDAFTAEVIRSAVVAITDEMKTNLMRTAYNMIIYEARGLHRRAVRRRTAIRSRSASACRCSFAGCRTPIKAKLAHWGKENIDPGDILLTNDPQVMGSHLNHMIFTLPVFHEGELVGFSSSMAHWQDVGGVLGGVTRDIFSEGLQMPFVKIFKRGEQDPELTAIIRNNCRLPRAARWAISARRSPRSAPASGACCELLRPLRRDDVQGELAADLRSERKACARRGGEHSRRRLRGRVVHGRRRRQRRQAHSRSRSGSKSRAMR